MAGGTNDDAAPDSPEPRYYLRSILFAFAAVAIGFAAFVFKVGTEADNSPWLDTAFLAALAVFLLITPPFTWPASSMPFWACGAAMAAWKASRRCW